MKVAFIGYMFSGKTTAAEHLRDSLGYTKLAFADPVKEISIDILNLMSERLGQPLNYWDMARVQERKGEPQVRKLLQLVGTELGRELIGNNDVWVDLLLHEAKQQENVVVDDCRFVNEAESLKSIGFMIVRIQRPEVDRLALLLEKYPNNHEEIMAHPSETSLADYEADLLLAADTVEALQKNVAVLVS